MHRHERPWVVALLVVLALCCFAANSVLCRLALRGGLIEAGPFTAVRLLSGAVFLGALLTATGRKGSDGPRWWSHGDWWSGTLLWMYAAAFSFAYLGLSAGTGALVLFGSVQATMIGVGLVRSDRPRPLEWVGLVVGFGGLVWLVLPGVSAPPLVSAGLMAVAGTAWGLYTLRGRASQGLAGSDPVAATAGNFLRSAPLAVVVAVPFLAQSKASAPGFGLAVVSGAVTSGLGYVLWYAALRSLTSTRAAVLQLSVPVLAALGGVLFLGETLSARLVVGTLVVLGGVGVALAAHSAESRKLR